MDRFISSHKNYSFWQLSEANLLSLAKFIVYENYNHHQILSQDLNVYNDEIQQIYQEEKYYFRYSKIFVAKNDNGEIVGAIRIMKWDRMEELPITKLFGIIDLYKISPENSNEHIWHIGRFAVHSDLGKYGVVLFKMLMVYAIVPICKYEKGIMFAECDHKLLRTVNLLGIKTITLNKGKQYLGSTTIPIYATRDGLIGFLAHNSSQIIDIEWEPMIETEDITLKKKKHLSLS